MRTTEIINKLDKKELPKWEAEVKSILDELNWNLIKTERALHLYQTNLQECTEKLESENKRAAETRTALQFLSANHPLRHRCEDDLYRTEIRIFRLENRLKKISIIKPIQLEIKRLVLAEEINYYEGILKSIENMLRPTVALRRVSDALGGDVVRNPLPDEGKIFILQPKQERMDDLDYYLPVAGAKDHGFFYIPQLKQRAMDDLDLVFQDKAHEFIRGDIHHILPSTGSGNRGRI